MLEKILIAVIVGIILEIFKTLLREFVDYIKKKFNR